MSLGFLLSLCSGLYVSGWLEEMLLRLFVRAAILCLLPGPGLGGFRVQLVLDVPH